MEKKSEERKTFRKPGKREGKAMKLSVQLTLFLGLLALIGMSIVNIGTIHLSRVSFTEVMNQNMEDKARATGEELSALISRMDGVSSIIDSGIQEMTDKTAAAWTILDINKEKQSVIPMKESSFRSRVVNQAVSSSQYNAETVLLESLYGVIAANDHVIGAGVFFEPNAYLEGVEDYAPYIGKEGFQNRSIVNYPYTEFKDKAYYTETKASGKTVITDVYETLLDKAKVITISRPVMQQGKFVGAILLDLDVSIFSSTEQKDMRYPSLDTVILNEDGEVMYSKKGERIGKSVEEEKGEKEYKKIRTEMEKGKAFYLLEKEKSGVTKRTYYVPTDVMGNTWWIMLSLNNGEFMRPILHILLLCFFLGFIGLLLIVSGIYFCVRRTLAPLSGMARIGAKVAKGDFSEEVSYRKENEIGQIGSAFQKVMDTVRGITEDLREKLEALSEGNFRINLEEEDKYQGAYLPLLQALRNIRRELNGTVLEIQKSASGVSASSEQVSASAQSLSQGATEQASSVEEISAGMNEISDSIKSTTEKAEDAAHLSRKAGEAVEVSNRKMEELSKAMAEITEKSGEIGKIIKTIDDIAFQTNILSLNAAIEAARAGEAGKGFAVVADEVGNLAQKSAKAAQNTGLLIEETKDAVLRGAKISKETEESLSTVVQHTGKINDMILDITKETERESEGMKQLTVGMNQISAVVQTNSATAEESAAASEELSGQAGVLDDLVSKFRLQEG